MIGKNSISLPEKQNFYSYLNTEAITDADYTHTNRVCKGFETKTLAEYYNLYVQSNTLLLADVFENFQNMHVEIDGLEPARFLTAPVLAWQGALKKAKVKLDLLIDIDMFFMVEKSIRGEICQFLNMCKLKTNVWKIMIKIKNHHTWSIGT